MQYFNDSKVEEDALTSSLLCNPKSSLNSLVGQGGVDDYNSQNRKEELVRPRDMPTHVAAVHTLHTHRNGLGKKNIICFFYHR